MIAASRSGVTDLVRRFDPGADPAARDSRRRTLELLRVSPAPFDRANYDPGHVTASAVVLAPDLAQVILVLHRRVGRWLQPGGHIEPYDRDVVATAAREVLEETGLETASGEPPLVAVDVHEIPARRGEPFHLHHDLTFAFRAPQPVPIRPGEAESVWCPVEQLDRYAVDDALARAVARALEHFAARGT